ncbi:hypothetical protein ACQ3I4_13650 [Zafaria sp. Z1313]|uniref:hypothetical protein n=1 Tax=Zafaria sp. Z1313 TaxID=3423202 RepID=UPI003D301B85
MIVMDGGLRALHHEALQRQARQRLDILDETRAALQAKQSGLNQRQIADLLVTSQPKVHRLLKAIDRRGGELNEDPEELILRAFVYDTPRDELVERLVEFQYSFGEDAPDPHEGRIPGTWDQVVSAAAQGLLNEDEFAAIRSRFER